MATASRSTKPNGGTSWQSGDTITQSGLEDDIANIYAQVNGNLDADNFADSAVTTAKIANSAITNAKVSASAAIAFSKLDQTSAAACDADVIDDHADDDATFLTATSPGTSASTSKPTNLEEEIERIRYVLVRTALGVNVKIEDGTNSAAWIDGRAIGPNLLLNGSFLDITGTITTDADPDTDAVLGWSIAGQPSTCEAETLPVAEGSGNSLHLADAAGATSDGISQTLSGLKASSLYLIEARVIPNTANVTLSTTGADAASSFDDLDLDSSGTSAQTIAGLIQTDSTPTDIVVSLNPDSTNYDFNVVRVSAREVTTTDLGYRH